MDCGDHPVLRVNRVADSYRSRREASKNFQVLEFIGHQETSSGCGLMGLGEKILSHCFIRVPLCTETPLTPITNAL